MDSYLIPLLVSGSLLLTLFAFYFTIFIIVNKSRQRKHQMEKTEMAHQYERAMLQTKLEVQEQALNQISQEIHDNVGQALSVVQANLTLLSAGRTERPGEEVASKSNELLTKAISDLRNLSHALNTEHISRIGLEDAIRKEIDNIRSFHQIAFELEAEGEPDGLSGEKELMIFRIAQEAFANIVKHAHADCVKVILLYEPSDFSMSIIDNGVGFDTGDENEDAGIGLVNMHQRIKLIKGSIHINSEKGKGTHIKLSIPL